MRENLMTRRMSIKTILSILAYIICVFCIFNVYGKDTNNEKDDGIHEIPEIPGLSPVSIESEWFQFKIAEKDCTIFPQDFPRDSDFFTVSCTSNITQVNIKYKSENGEIFDHMTGSKISQNRQETIILREHEDDPIFSAPNNQYEGTKKVFRICQVKQEGTSYFGGNNNINNDAISFLPPHLDGFTNTLIRPNQSELNLLNSPVRKDCQYVNVFFTYSAKQKPFLEDVKFSTYSSALAPKFKPTRNTNNNTTIKDMSNNSNTLMTVDNTDYKIDLYTHETTIISIKSSNDYFSSFIDPKYAINNSALYEFSDCTREGKVYKLDIYAVSCDRKNSRKYTISINCVKSINPRLNEIYIASPIEGGFIDIFDPYKTYYMVSVPSKTKAITLNLVPENNKDTELYINGKNLGYGKKTTTIYLETDDPIGVVVSTKMKSGYSIAYLLSIQPNGAGLHALAGLELLGARISQPFSPSIHEYTAYIYDQKQKFLGMKFKKRLQETRILVNGLPIETDTFSPHSGFIKLSPGEKKKFIIDIFDKRADISQTLINTYTINVIKVSPSWSENHRIINNLSALGCYGNVIINTANSMLFMSGAKFLQFLSVTSSISGNPEIWQSFTEIPNKFNLQYILPNIAIKKGNTIIFSQNDGTSVYIMKPKKLKTENIVKPETEIVDYENDSYIEETEDFAKGDQYEMRRLELYAESLGIRNDKLKDSFIVKLSENEQYPQMIMRMISSLHIYFYIIIYATLAYCILWVLYLRGESILSLRQDYPIYLHPSTFWILLLDYCLISIIQSTMTLISLDKSMTVLFQGKEVGLYRLMMTCILLLLVYPIGFILYSGFVLAKIKKDFVYSKTLCKYTDKNCIEVKARISYFSWIPIISDICTWEVKSAAPIGDPCTRSKSVFNTNHRYIALEDANVDYNAELCNPQTAQVLLAPIKNNTNSETMICNSETLTQSIIENKTEMCLYSAPDKILEPINDTNSAYRENEISSRLRYNDGMIQVLLNEQAYKDNKYSIANSKVTETCPEAVIGYSKLEIKNSYSSTMVVNTEIQLQHISPLLQTARNFVFWTPVENLQLEKTGLFGPFLNVSSHNRFFTFFLDRVYILGIIFLISLSRNMGSFSYIMYALCSLLLAISYIPSSIATGTIKWQRYLENEHEKDKNENNGNFQNNQDEHEQELNEKYENLRKIRSQYSRNFFEIIYFDLILESYRYILSQPILKTKGYFIFKEIIIGNCIVEILKFFILIFLFSCNNKTGTLSGFAGEPIIAIFLSIFVLFMINIKSMVLSINQWGLFIHRISKITYICLEWSLEFLSNIKEYLHIALFYVKLSFNWVLASLSKNQIGRKSESFRYPNRVTPFGVMRISEVDTVNLVVPEIGLILPAQVTPSRNFITSWLKQKRSKLYKTVYYYGPTGGIRNCETKLPITQSFGGFLEGSNHHVNRLVATIQVVNHSGLRYPSTSYYHGDADDSYLSLYTDTQYIKHRGDVHLHPGHQGHVVRYEPKTNSVMIKGPGIKPDVFYTVQSEIRDKSPCTLSKNNDNNTEINDECIFPSINAIEPSTIGGDVVGDTVCESAGRLDMILPENMIPNLYHSITVEGTSGTIINIDPSELEVNYEASSGELILRHKEIQRGGKYSVSWRNYVCGPTVQGENRANGLGVLTIPLGNDDSLPVCLYNHYIYVTDPWGHSVQIDPRYTDTYEMAITSEALSGKDWVKMCATSLYRRARNVLKGEKPLPEKERWIPCTVTQCLDPVDKQYRVEPNYEAFVRALDTDVHEFEALLIDLRTREDGLESVALDVMSETQFVQFWTQNGVEVAYDTRWINPLNEKAHPLLAPHLSLISTLEKKLKGKLDAILRQRIDHTQTEIVKYRMIAAAYEDEDLYRAQLALDNAEWNGFESTETIQLRQIVDTKKQPYVDHVGSLLYPCDISAHSLSFKPLLSQQYRVWEEKIALWLQQEVGASEDAYIRESNRLSSILDHIIKTVKVVFESKEDSNKGEYKSVLHFVMNSLTACGKEHIWKPDPISSSEGYVRCFSTRHDNTVDRTSPVWIPCMIKLNCSNLSLLFIDPVNAPDFAGKPSPSWKALTGWVVPLQAFNNTTLFEIDHFAEDEHNVSLQGSKLCIAFEKSENTIASTPSTIQWGGCTYSIDMNAPCEEGGPDGLLFRISASLKPKWQSVIYGAQMTSANHSDERMPTMELKRNQAPSIAMNEMIHTNEGKYQHDEPTIAAIAEELNVPLVMAVENQSSFDSNHFLQDLDPVFIPKNGTNIQQAYYDYTKNPPALLGRYIGSWSNNRYHGYGCLYNCADTLVYSGQWACGQRWGNGTCLFKDAEGVEWMYTGEFVEDQILGQGILTIVDKHVHSSISKGGAEQKFHLLQFQGNLICNSVNPDSEAPSATESMHSVDTMKLFCASGEEELRYSDPNSYKMKYSKIDYAWDFQTIDEYLPFFAKWTRLCDPKQGFQDILSRISSNTTARTADDSVFQGQIENGRIAHVEETCSYNTKTISFEGHLPFMDAAVGVFTSKETEDSYSGDWHFAQPSGKGLVKIVSKGLTVKGGFLEGLPHGETKIETTKGVDPGAPFLSFKGMMKRGQFSDKGTIKYTNYVYEGDFSSGRRSGQGILKDTSEQIIYDGEWLDDYPHGRATHYKCEELVYIGGMTKGKRSGFGRLFGANKKMIYQGLWLDDLPHGNGTIFTSKGIYEGIIAAGKKSGFGKFTFNESPSPNGKKRVYKGEWSNDVPHGLGEYPDRTGVVRTFKFERGNLVEASRGVYKPGCGSLPDINNDYQTPRCNFKVNDSSAFGSKLACTPTYVVDTIGKVTQGWSNYQHSPLVFSPPQHPQTKQNDQSNNEEAYAG